MQHSHIAKYLAAEVLVVTGIVFLIAAYISLATKPSQFVTVAETVSLTCDKIFLNLNYAFISKAGTINQYDWTGPFANNDKFVCVGADGSNPGPWRAAVYQGEPTVANIKGFISKTGTNSQNFTPALTAPPPSGSFYTIACLEVTPQGNWQDGKWEPKGKLCPVGKIFPAGTLVASGPVGDPPVSCGDMDTNADGKIALTDLSEFAKKYKRSCTDCNFSTQSKCGKVDVNNDCKIDLVDLSEFAKKYNQAACT
jgi:hypothetical protein